MSTIRRWQYRLDVWLNCHDFKVLGAHWAFYPPWVLLVLWFIAVVLINGSI